MIDEIIQFLKPSKESNNGAMERKQMSCALVVAVVSSLIHEPILSSDGQWTCDEDFFLKCPK